MNLELRSSHRPRGVTLVELTVATAIAALLAAVAVAPFTQVVHSKRLTSATNDLLGALILARSEAVKRSRRVVVCKSPDANTCVSTGNWAQGWIVYVDTNNNGLHESVEEILHTGQELHDSLVVKGNPNVARYVSYSARGESRLLGGNFQAGTITLCNRSTDATEARELILSATGRPRVRRASLASCL